MTSDTTYASWTESAADEAAVAAGPPNYMAANGEI
jgi:hypothetical protein